MQKLIGNTVIVIVGGLIMGAALIGLAVIAAGATCIVMLRRVGLVKTLPAGN